MHRCPPSWIVWRIARSVDFSCSGRFESDPENPRVPFAESSESIGATGAHRIKEITTNVVHKTPLNTDKSKSYSITPILLKIELGLHFIMINISRKFRYKPSATFWVILKTDQQTNDDKRHTDTTDNITFARIGGGNKQI